MKTKNIKGFSYIEMIVYVGIVGMMVSAMVMFVWETIYWKEKLSLQGDITYNLNLAMQKIAYEVRVSSNYNINSSSSITLGMDDVNRSPTNIDLYNGRIRFIPGNSHPCNLTDSCYITSDDVYVENLIINDLSSPDSETKIIRLIITIGNNPSLGRSEYEFSDTYITSIEIK